MTGFSLIKPYFKKYKWMVAAGFIFLVIADLSQLLIPYIIGRSIDFLSTEGSQSSDLFKPVLHILILAIIIAGSRFAWRNLIIGFGRIVEKNLRDKLYEKIIYLSPRWHMENSSGDIMAMGTNDMDNIRVAISAGLISIADTLFMGCAALGFMLAISPSLCLWALLPMPLISLCTHFLGSRIYRLVLDVQNVFGTLTESIREKLSGFRVIRAMGLNNLALEETEKIGRDYLKINIKHAVLAGTFFPFLHLMSNLAVSLVIYFGGRETILGRVTTGDFIAFMSYLAMLTWPLMALGMIIGFIQQGLASLARLERVFSQTDEKRTAINSSSSTAPADIELINLNFQYPSREKPALKQINLKLKHDQITALVGPMGSGKSTLATLLPALQHAPKGSLIVAGLPVEKWSPYELRSLFGYVPQDGFLFSGSIFENIAFGKPQASREEVLEAVNLSGLNHDLDSFPEGFETIVGERGLSLSGGQRQRLALARALLTEPPYLILDDTLSAVDAAVEAEIMSKLLPKRRGRGALIISHRLSSLMGVDQIVVLENGCISDIGTPEELINREGYFKRVSELNTLSAGGDHAQ